MRTKEIEVGSYYKVVSRGKIVDVMVIAIHRIESVVQRPAIRFAVMLKDVGKVLPGLRTAAALHPLDWQGGRAPAGWQFQKGGTRCTGFTEPSKPAEPSPVIWEGIRE